MVNTSDIIDFSVYATRLEAPVDIATPIDNAPFSLWFFHFSEGGFQKKILSFDTFIEKHSEKLINLKIENKYDEKISLEISTAISRRIIVFALKTFEKIISVDKVDRIALYLENREIEWVSFIGGIVEEIFGACSSIEIFFKFMEHKNVNLKIDLYIK